MKITRFTFLFITICLSHQVSLGNPMKLSEIQKKNFLNLTIHGNSNSTHYLEPIIAELSNTGKEIVTIRIETGDMFIPEDSTKQNIVATENREIVLQPMEKKSVLIKGMCTEQHDGSGNNETVYHVATRSGENLKKLTAYIADKHYQTSSAQYAVWSLMDNTELSTIYSSDTTEENDLRKFMASITGKPIPIKSKDYRQNYYGPIHESVGGNFEFSFSKPKDVQIAMFDKNGILVRELYNEKKVVPGNHTLNFEFDSSVYTDDIYLFKLIAENRVMIEQELDAKSIRDSFKQKVRNRQ